MELVADIGTGVVVAICRTMPCSCVRVGCVDLPTVWSDTEHLCLSHGLLDRPRLLDQLCIDSLAVQFDGIDRSLECTPGLDVGAVDRDRAAGEIARRDSGAGKPVGEPLSVHVFRHVLQQFAQLGEQPGHPRVGFVLVPVLNPDPAPVVLVETIQYPCRFDQMSLVIAL